MNDIKLFNKGIHSECTEFYCRGKKRPRSDDCEDCNPISKRINRLQIEYVYDYTLLCMYVVSEIDHHKGMIIDRSMKMINQVFE